MKITRKRLKQLINESIAELNGDMDEACGPSMAKRPKKKIAIIKLAEEDETDEGKKLDVGPVNEDEDTQSERSDQTSLPAPQGPSVSPKFEPGESNVSRIVRGKKPRTVIPDERVNELDQGDEGGQIDLEEWGDITGMPQGGKVVDLEENLDLRQFVSDIIYGLLNEQEESMDEQDNMSQYGRSMGPVQGQSVEREAPKKQKSLKGAPDNMSQYGRSMGPVQGQSVEEKPWFTPPAEREAPKKQKSLKGAPRPKLPKNWKSLSKDDPARVKYRNWAKANKPRPQAGKKGSPVGTRQVAGSGTRVRQATQPVALPSKYAKGKRAAKASGKPVQNPKMQKQIAGALDRGPKHPKLSRMEEMNSEDQMDRQIDYALGLD